MRTHTEIITATGGPAAIAKIVGADPNSAKQWRRNDSIPSKHWHALVAAGHASWAELGAATALKAGAPLTPPQDAAA